MGTVRCTMQWCVPHLICTVDIRWFGLVQLEKTMFCLLISFPPFPDATFILLKVSCS